MRGQAARTVKITHDAIDLSSVATYSSRSLHVSSQCLPLLQLDLTQQSRSSSSFTRHTCALAEKARLPPHRSPVRAARSNPTALRSRPVHHTAPTTIPPPLVPTRTLLSRESYCSIDVLREKSGSRLLRRCSLGRGPRDPSGRDRRTRALGRRFELVRFGRRFALVRLLGTSGRRRHGRGEQRREHRQVARQQDAGALPIGRVDVPHLDAKMLRQLFSLSACQLIGAVQFSAVHRMIRGRRHRAPTLNSVTRKTNVKQRASRST
eukprot:1289261-Pyramimonas_sp.AAC.1